MRRRRLLEHDLPNRIDQGSWRILLFHIPKPLPNAALAHRTADARPPGPPLAEDRPLLTKRPRIETLPSLPRLRREECQESKILRRGHLGAELAADTTGPLLGSRAKHIPLAANPPKDIRKVPRVERIGKNAVLFTQIRTEDALLLHRHGSPHGEGLQPPGRHPAGVADVGERCPRLAQDRQVVVHHQEPLDELDAQVGLPKHLVKQPRLVRMVGVLRGPGDEHVQRSAGIRARRGRHRKPERFGKHAHRARNQLPHVPPLGLVGGQQLIEQPKPWKRGLDMKVVVRRVTEDRARQVLEVRGEKMPLQHLRHVEIGGGCLVEKPSYIGIRTVGLVVRVEPVVHDVETGILSDRGDEIPLASPVALGEHPDARLAEEGEEIPGMREVDGFQPAHGAGILPVEPAHHGGIKSSLRRAEGLEPRPHPGISANEAAGGPGLPVIGCPEQGGRGVVALAEGVGRGGKGSRRAHKQPPGKQEQHQPSPRPHGGAAVRATARQGDVGGRGEPGSRDGEKTGSPAAFHRASNKVTGPGANPRAGRATPPRGRKRRRPGKSGPPPR